MIISQSGIVDIIPEYNRQLRPIFCVSEGDKNTRMINITVQQAGENFSIPSGASVYVTGKKQDNTIFTYQCTKSGYIVSFQIAEQMSAANGIVLCELQIIENGNPLGSANFVYWVEPSPVQNGTASESDLNVFLEAILGAEKLDRFYANVEDMVAQAVENMQIHEGQTVIDASLSVSGAAADAKATGDIVRSFMNALITETTEESTVATCDDAAGGLPLKTLTANIVPTQSGSGDPSPDNVRPISGYTGVTVTRTGINRFPFLNARSTSAKGVSVVCDGHGTITMQGTATANDYISLFFANTLIIPDGEIYKFCLLNTASSSESIFRFVNGSTIVDSWAPTTINREMNYSSMSGKTVTGVRIYITNGSTYNMTMRPMFVPKTQTVDGYISYEGQTYAVNFPSEAGTVSGGTLTVNSDGSGTLVVNQKRVTLTSTMDWRALGSVGGSFRIYTNFADHAPMTDGWTYDDIKCSHLTFLQGNTGDFGTFNYTFAGNFTIKDNNGIYGTAEGLKQWLDDQNTANTPVQVTYPVIATTYALSAVQVAIMLNGVNNIWTDAAGTVSGEYYASTALYVQKIVNAQKGMIAGVEEAMIATKNYSVNDLLIVGNTLYKVTAAISSGAALVIGTNIAQTTVAEQLIALANA